MIDDIKIKEAAMQHSRWLSSNHEESTASDSFMEGAKWAINGFLNDLNELLHPASEVPRNDNGKILAFSKVNSNIKLYDMNAMLDETTCNTYQEMWEVEVMVYRFTNWIFVEELFDMIMKGGEQ